MAHANDGLLYFVADDGVAGLELWQSDGSGDGTAMVMDLREGSYGSHPKELTVVGNSLYFLANDGLRGFELYKH